MTTMELEAQKAELARHILNIDNMEVIKEMKKAYSRTVTRLAKKTVQKKAAPDSKEYILDSIEQGLKDVKEGKTRPLEELLNEL